MDSTTRRIATRVNYDRLDWLTDHEIQHRFAEALNGLLMADARRHGIGLMLRLDARSTGHLYETTPFALEQALRLPSEVALGSFCRFLRKHGGPQLDLSAADAAFRSQQNSEIRRLLDKRRKTKRGATDRAAEQRWLRELDHAKRWRDV